MNTKYYNLLSLCVSLFLITACGDDNSTTETSAGEMAAGESAG